MHSSILVELKKIVSLAFVLMLLSTGVVVRFVGPVVAEGTIYIRSDGSVEGTDEIQRDGNVYTFTNNFVNQSVVVERDDIVVDGAGYALQGTGSGTGLDLSDRSNVTIKNTEIKQFGFGIYLNHSSSNGIIENHFISITFECIRLYESSNNTIATNNLILNDIDGITLYGSSNNSITKNYLMSNYDGIRLYESSNNNITENIVTENYYGIFLASSCGNNIVNNNVTANHGTGISLVRSSNENRIVKNHIASNSFRGMRLNESSNNVIYHNNFLDNTEQVHNINSTNVWDVGYPSGGNYWSDYNDTDANHDGIGDTPYIIDENNRDRYPLMYPWSPLPVHNINTGLGYATIQEAINSNETLNGHTIFVEEGIYCENLVVNKSLSLNGENRDNTVIDGNFTGTVINIQSDNVNITGFAIQNSGYGYGVYVELSDGNNISHNIITNNYVGIALENSSRNNIYGNNIKANNVSGVFLGDSSNNTISGNDITANYDYGIRLDDSSNNTISGNKITNNGSGIWLGYSSNHNSISGNDITANNLDGITLSNSIYNSISGNNITANERDGIGLYSSSSINSIRRNNITNNQYGIELYDSSNHNTISKNNIANNNRSIWLFKSSFTSVYHNNFINNTERVATLSSVLNVWDNGYPSGGNYWSDYIATANDIYFGLFQNETGSDGIADTPYVINSNNQDNYPLMGMFHDFTVWDNETYHITTICNFTISDFNWGYRMNITGTWEKALYFNVFGPEDTVGFCRIMIPRAFLEGPYTVLFTNEVNSTELPISNSTHVFLYIIYNHSGHVMIIPELPTWTATLLTLIMLTVTIALYKRRLLKTPIH